VLKTLTYNAEFATTGRQLSQQLEFETGLIAITGANEAGKSFALEMIRFAWFGVGALRGQASDFTKLEVNLSWDMKGAAYTVERTLKNAKLQRDGQVIAVSTSAVNNCLLDLIGFGLPVFDVACVANQGDIEKLSTMRPTERKRLVDSVIGIGALEVLAKWSGEEALLREKEAVGTRAGIRPVIAPEEPQDYEPSTVLREKLTEAEEVEGQIYQLKAELAVQRIAPEKPKETVNLPASALEPLAAAQLAKKGELSKAQAQLKAIGNPQAVDEAQLAAVEEQIRGYEDYVRAQNYLRLHPKPDLARQLVQEGLRSWDEYDDWLTKVAEVDRLLAARRQELATLQAGQVDCPSCGHGFTPGAQRTLQEIESEIAAIEMATVKTANVLTPPVRKRRDLEALERVWQHWDQQAYDEAAAVPAVEKPGLTLLAISAARQNNQLAAQRLSIEAQVKDLEASLTGQQDFVTMLATRRAYEQALVEWRKASEEYSAWVGDRAVKHFRLVQLERKGVSVSGIRDCLTRAQIYEHSLQAYEAAVAANQELEARAVSLETEVDQYRRVRKAFIDLRQSVKQHLLPSLNAVASQLLRQFTGGGRQVVKIDDEFEIWVDGQKIHTLSGSGKACANLAIRIALGQVLTSRVFPLFLGDEIDASMDEFRAEQTALTLRSITDRISQLVLVSHKTVEADQTIHLET
jgi:exonuclease SbcC